MKHKIIIFALFFICALLTTQQYATAETKNSAYKSLPRFASFSENPAQMRTGPDIRYPIKWIYTKEGVPVKIILEMNNWRKVKDWEGTEGWVFRGLLSGKRTLRVTGVTRPLRSMADEKAPTIAYIEPGVFGEILECPKSIKYCKVKIDKYTGWLPRNAFWGLLPNEIIE